MFLFSFIGEAILIALAILGLAAFFAHRIAKAGGTDGVMSLPSKVLLTAVLLGAIGYTFWRSQGSKGGQVIALFMVLLVAIPLVVMWLPQLVDAVLSPLFGSMTGGNEQVEAKPMYFRAQGLRKRGDFAGAIQQAELELARFPGDLEGVLLIADLTATDLKDPLTALERLEEAAAEPGRSASDRSLILSRIADVQLNSLGKPAVARETLQRILDEFPDTEAANLARQRIAHLPGVQQLADKAERPKLVMKPHDERVGLASDLGTGQLEEDAAMRETQKLTAHLDQFPDDWESREQLARLYMDPLGRLDLATEQLEQLIGQSGTASRHVIRWLNELTDLQLKSADGTGAAKLTLERIVNGFPGTPAAEQAQVRIQHLGLDRRAKEAPKTLKLGNYEKNIGLKRGDPTIPDPSKGSTVE